MDNNSEEKEYRTIEEIKERLAIVRKLKQIKIDALEVNMADLKLYQTKFKLKERDLQTIEELKADIERISNEYLALEKEEKELKRLRKQYYKNSESAPQPM